MKKVAVVGGGIGGLTAAIAIMRIGIEVDVFEQASELVEVGAGISISPNGARVLYSMGLSDALREIGTSPKNRELRHWQNGRAWKQADTGEVVKDGAQRYFVHRGDLQALLIKEALRLNPNCLHLGARCIGVTQNDDKTIVHFDDGRIATADIVIGADGIQSMVRRALHGPDRPNFTGCVAWRGLVPMKRVGASISRENGTTWVGPSAIFQHYPLRGGDLLNVIAIVERSDWQVESWRVKGSQDEFKRDFPDWNPEVHLIIDNIVEPYKWALMVREPMSQWTLGRVSLLGDACHSTLPFLGQGAVMSIEDACVLARSLEKYTDMREALSRYESIRRERTAQVVRKSFEYRTYSFRKDAANLDDEKVLEWEAKRSSEHFDWLYSYNAVTLEV